MAGPARAHGDDFAHIVRDMTRPLSLGFGAFIAWQAVEGWIELSGTERLIVATADTIVAVYLFTLAGFMWFKPPPLRTMNGWGASVGIALASTDMITMAVRGHIPSFPATVLVLAGLGVVVLSWRWLLATEVSILLVWYALATLFADNPSGATFLLQIGVITGVAVHWGRLRAYTQLITAREREHEANAKLQELNDELERFSAVVAHDLKNPITAIRIKLRAMRSRSNDAQVQGAAVDLDRMANSMNTLIEDLLAYAKAGSALEFAESRPLDEVATEVVELLSASAAEAGGVIRIEPLPHYEADRTLLRQLLQNLIGNSIAHRSERPPDIVLAGAESVDSVQFWVQDNGTGFDASKSEELFEPFRRGQVGVPGHGLGLATCARIVARLGGSIQAESTPGVGSKFTVTLPKEEMEKEEESGLTA